MSRTPFPVDLRWIRPSLALFTAAMSILSLVEQNQKRATACSDLHFRWNRLANDYEALWDDVYSEDAAAKLKALTLRIAEFPKGSTAIPYHERIMVKWQDHVERHHGLPAAG